MNTIYSDIEVG